MKPDASHIRQIKVVSNTHWDREFRRSFEKTRRRLLDMLDITLDILERDPKYHSYTLDGHSILIEDYLEMRPERREQIERFLKSGRLVAGPWFTLVEQFSVGAEALVRNFLFGRSTVERYGGRVPNVAYTPASWGQTGQLPQILQSFGIDKMMFYRGISHDEADAEWIWVAPDGTEVLASRFAIYARYNWYYQVHRVVTVGTDWDKTYVWGDRTEVPVRFADGLAGEDLGFDLKAPQLHYDKTNLRAAIEKMVDCEGAHYTTPVFLAMNGHDISVAYPLESQVIEDAQEVLGDRYEIEHTDLEGFWKAAEEHIDRAKLPHLKGERRSHLRKGAYTYLFPATISARSYLKQQDFGANTALAYYAEPLASLAMSLGADYPRRYLDRGWRFLLENHTHDANGGCAPDAVCQDMSYRYRKACDIGDIVTEDSLAHVARSLSPKGQDPSVMQLVVFNPLPFERDVQSIVDVEVPRELGAGGVKLSHPDDPDVPIQPTTCDKSSVFVDSVWDLPRILDSHRIKCHARFSKLPALGYRAYQIETLPSEPRPPKTLVCGPGSMQNEHLRVDVNGNGTIDITDKATGRTFAGLNYLSDEGEVGNAWRHVSPAFDRKYTSRGLSADVAVVESGPLTACISAELRFPVPLELIDDARRSTHMVELPVKIHYRLRAGGRRVEVTLDVDNRARDHWLRVNFPTGLSTDVSIADSHFDVVEREIPLPDSTGWVERVMGTHPLRTFAALSDGQHTLALMPKGIFEYEALEDGPRTLALTLVRACRIKLAVSEEKQTVLPDPGVQCPGEHHFEYAIGVMAGDWSAGDWLNAAADYFVPVRAIMTGRGNGRLPLQQSLFSLEGSNVHVSAVKQGEDGRGVIIRLFNALDRANAATLRFGVPIAAAVSCGMDETGSTPLQPSGSEVRLELGAKKIETIRVECQPPV